MVNDINVFNFEKEVGAGKVNIKLELSDTPSRKIYVLSNTEFDTLEEAQEAVQELFEDGDLPEFAAIYETTVSQTYSPKIALVQEEEENETE